MSNPYLSEIRMMAFNFPPKGWALCNGQLLPINQNQALFSILGTTYGGNGTTTFGLPDLRGRTPLHFGNGTTQGEKAGEETHVLSTQEIPPHTHSVRASTDATGSTNTPASNVLVNSAPNNLYGPAQNAASMSASTVSTGGGSVGHQNMQPYQTVSFCIALVGIFPSRN